jgi:glycogen synthase
MKIVMTTVPFLPRVGGMETVVALLGRELVRLGCDVKVTTAIRAEQHDSFCYDVIRRPGVPDLLRLHGWADVYLLHGPSLKFGWPVFLGSRKPSFIVHHIWMAEGGRNPVFARWLRTSLLNRCRNLAVSNAVGKSLPVPWEAVPNPYDDKLFRMSSEIPRDRDLVFLGRLDRLKGADDLIDALGILKRNGYQVTLTIVGEGPMRELLEAKARKLGLSDWIDFAGERKPGEGLTSLLNRHKVLVVPSRWEEPFGIVALEGIASGCVVIGSHGGGLPEAIGPCGITFPNGDAMTLASSIQTLLSRSGMLEGYQANAKVHLAAHRPSAVARRYLQLLETAI